MEFEYGCVIHFSFLLGNLYFFQVLHTRAYKTDQPAPRGIESPVKHRFMTDFYLPWLKLCGKYGNVKSAISEKVNGSIC